MLRKLTIHRFKSIEHAELEFGKLNVFIGSNASGKSNFFDALRVLQGIGNGFSIDEIFNGKPQSSTNNMWAGIRGGSLGAVYRSLPGLTQPETFQIDVEVTEGRSRIFYSIEINPGHGYVVNEALQHNGNPIYYSKEPVSRNDVAHRIASPPPGKGNHKVVDLMRNIPALAQILDNRVFASNAKQRSVIVDLIEAISDIQRLDLIPEVLRDYSGSHSALRVGERGEDFASVVSNILSDPEKKSDYIDWLKKLTPFEVDNVEILKGALGEYMFAIEENNNITPAPSLSDGTLRFSAIAAALFQPNMPKMFLIEEVDNGIHPTRLRLLLELLTLRSQKSETQIFVTTHSPVLLAWLANDQYQYTFHCSRNSDGSSRILSLLKIDRFKDVISSESLSGLFTEGWLENAQ